MARQRDPNKTYLPRPVFEVRFCVHCSRRLKGGSIPWDIGVCGVCLNTLPDYKGLIRADNRQRARKHYLTKKRPTALTPKQAALMSRIESEPNGLLTFDKDFDRRTVTALVERNILQKTDKGFVPNLKIKS